MFILGEGGAGGRNELTGRDPATRHCGSTGKAGREKGGGRDRDLELLPAREAVAEGAEGAERGRGAGPPPLGNLRRLRSERPREDRERSGKFGNLRHQRGAILEVRLGRSSSRREEGGVCSFKGGATAEGQRSWRGPRVQ